MTARAQSTSTYAITNPFAAPAVAPSSPMARPPGQPLAAPKLAAEAPPGMLPVSRSSSPSTMRHATTTVDSDS